MDNQLTPVEALLLRLDHIDAGGEVKRMHTVPTLREQTVAAHSFGVAWWCWMLSPAQRPSANLLMAALAHDVPEHAVGDIPAPTKRLLGRDQLDAMEAEADLAGGLPVFELTEAEARILKMADCFDLLMTCVKEAEMGNRRQQLLAMKTNVVSYLCESINSELELQVIQRLQVRFERAAK